MIMVVYDLQPTLLSVMTEVCVFVCAHADSSAYFRVRKVGVIAAESGYCVLYHADKPIRGTTIDINFPFLPLSPLSEVFFI